MQERLSRPEAPWALPVRFLATGAFTGYLPVAPGTWGTLAAVPLCLALHALGPLGYGLGTLALSLVAVPVAGACERLIGRQDPGPVVIDEIAGFLVTMLGVAPGWLGLSAGFLLFRVFDILKPPPAGRSQALPGGWGIVADDLIAGLYANLALRAGWWLAGWT